MTPKALVEPGVQCFNAGGSFALEWRDPRGLGFSSLCQEMFVLQRGSWDQLGFLRLRGLPIE